MAKIICSIFIKFLTVILALFLLILIPIFILTSIPLLLLRQFIAKIAPCINPNLSKMVTTRGQLLAADDHYRNPKCTIVLSSTLIGNVDLTVAQDTLQKRQLKAKFPSGELKYPELQQYLTTWMGYYFWKQDKTFNLKDHVRLHQRCTPSGDRFTEEDIAEIRQELLTKKWTKKKPLWEYVIVPNYYPNGEDKPHTAMYFRFAHCLGDGYSFLNLFTKYYFDGNENYSFVEQPREKFSFVKLLYKLTLPLRIPFAVAETLLLPLSNQPWRVSLEKQKVGNTVIDLARKISMPRLKEIKNHFNVNLSSVLMAIIAGAQRDLLIKQKCKVADNGVPFATMLPLPNHTEKLRNFMTIGHIPLPIGEPDPVKRLQMCFKNYQTLKTGTIPYFFVYVLPIAGSFFTCATKLFSKNQLISTGITNLPGWTTQQSFAGHKCIDINFNCGLLNGCAGTGYCIVSYADNVRIAPMAHSEIMSREDLREMTLLVEKHFDILYQQIT